MFDITKYQSELGEKAIQIILERWYSLSLVKIPETNDTTTPDYEIRDSTGKVIAVSEVKSLVNANVPDYDPNATPENLAKIAERRYRSHRGKLVRHHGKAISQLASYRSLPTLIIFASFDMTDHIDMIRFLQDQRESCPDASLADLYLLIKIHQKAIPSDSFEVTSTAYLLHSNEIGEKFGYQHLSLEEAVLNNGFLPATFHIDIIENLR